MNPFFFGSSTQPLYGVYHPARGDRSEPAAVLLCYPMGIEYMRAHRAFRQLTHLLVRAGCHVLRFDYFGTGDSAGVEEEASLGRWVDDVGAAAVELADNSGIDRIGMVGLRLGATLAAMAAARLGTVERLVLWDPVIDGPRYLDELRAFAERSSRVHNGSGWPVGTVGVGGFALTESLRAEIRTIDLLAHDPPAAAAISMLTSADREIDRRLEAQWRSLGANCQYRCVPSENRWAEGDAFGSALIPQDIIQAVVEYFGEGVPL